MSTLEISPDMYAFVKKYINLMGGPIEDHHQMDLETYLEARAEKIKRYDSIACEKKFEAKSDEASWLLYAKESLLRETDDQRPDLPFRPPRPEERRHGIWDDRIYPDLDDGSTIGSSVPSVGDDKTSHETKADLTSKDPNSFVDEDSKERLCFIDKPEKTE